MFDSSNVLGRSIGRLAAAHDGLNAVFVPARAPRRVATSIVREANELRPSETPFAILVSDNALDHSVPTVSRAAAIQYRLGDRLAVIPATTVDIASFDGSFREVVGPGFPATARTGYDVSALAHSVAQLLAEEVGRSLDEGSVLAMNLDRCMRQVASILEEEREGAASWNSLWFVLVDRALDALLRTLRASLANGGTIDSAGADYAWAAFGLPRPKKASDWAHRPKQFVEALSVRWASEELTDEVEAEARVAKQPNWEALTRCHQVGWTGLSDSIARTPSVLVGLQDCVCFSPERLQAFSQVDEEGFFGASSNEGTATISTLSGASASIAPEPQSPKETPSPVYVLTSEEDDSCRASEWFKVHLPLLGPDDREEAQGFQVMPRVATKAYQLGPIRSAKMVGTTMEFEMRVESKGKDSGKLDKVVFAIEVKGDSVGYFKSQMLTLFVVPPGDETVVYAPYVGKRVSTPKVADPDSETLLSNETKAGSKHRLFVFSDSDARSTGVALRKDPSGRGWSGDLPADTDASVTNANQRWTFEAATAAVSSQSVLAAAVRKVTVDAADPGLEETTGLLGRLESLMASEASTARYVDAAGHVVMPTVAAKRDVVLSSSGELLVPAEFRDLWGSTTKQEGEPSDTWQRNRAAFVSAWKACTDLLAPVADDTLSAGWPSKRSTAPLAQRPDLLEAMLVAFRRWNEESVGDSALHRFLAAYPFSFSGWELVDAAKLRVVLLSPWHPIRLAWTTAIETTLRDTVRAADLVGTVEGWAFPMIGRSAGKQGRLVALPMEMGREDLFASWSVMVPVPMGQEEPLTSPSELVGFPMPGTSASGLTASAADAALRDFRRVNSYLPSVTVDLSSSVKARRMEQIDRSVLGAVKEWAGGRTGNPVMGITILDSLNRLGDLPREEVRGLLESCPRTMVAWKRYLPDPIQPRKSNLRLLQDSGVRMLLESQAEGSANGVLGQVPLRRFEVPCKFEQHASLLQPTVRNTEGAFSEALACVEKPDGLSPEVGVYVSQSQLSDDHSDWSISGDAFVPAAVLARSVAMGKDAGRRMLWEWRPPFLQTKGESRLNRRPYASVMRVGSQLAEKLDMHLRRIDASAATSASSVLATLGQQGIGLSSLLTMGGHHSSGALGFYLALKLMQAALPDGPDDVQVVMPIDACRQFLDVLSGIQQTQDTTRQADLLVLRFSGSKLSLVPVEIKMYGLDGETKPRLAEPGPDLAEPLEQLQSTMKLLAQVQAERERLSSEEMAAERALWDNALTSLFEAGLRLSEDNWGKPEGMRTALQCLLDGEYDIALATPLVLHFSHDPAASDEFRVHRIQNSPDAGSLGYGALCARPSLVMKETQVETGFELPAHRAWKELLEWAVSSALAEPLVEVTLETDAIDPVNSDEDDDVVPRLPEPVAPTNAMASRLPDAAPEVEPTTPSASVTDAVGPETFRPRPTREGGVRVRLGRQAGALTEMPVDYWPSNTDTTQLNIGIVGDLGTGKTQLLQALLANIRHGSRAAQDIPTNGLIFDYKADFQGDSFVAATGATVWQPFHIPLNVLQLREPYCGPAAQKRASAFVSMLAKIYGGIGPVQRSKLTGVIRQLFEETGGIAPTMGQVLACYREVAQPDAVSSILETLVYGEIFSEDQSSLCSLSEAMADTLLVVNLNDLGADTSLKNTLVVLFLDMFYEEMKRSKKTPFKVENGATLRTLNSYLVVDEASNIMAYDFPVLESLLKEGREFGVGVILSSQYLSHFKSGAMDFAETLSTWFVHKVPNVTTAQLSSLGISKAGPELAEKIKSLAKHQSLYRSDLVSARFIVEVPFYELVKQEDFAHYSR